MFVTLSITKRGPSDLKPSSSIFNGTLVEGLTESETQSLPEKKKKKPSL